MQVAVDMLVGSTTRAQIQIGDRRLPVGVVTAQAYDRALAGHRVLVLLAGMGHVAPLTVAARAAVPD